MKDNKTKVILKAEISTLDDLIPLDKIKELINKYEKDKESYIKNYGNNNWVFLFDEILSDLKDLLPGEEE